MCQDTSIAAKQWEDIFKFGLLKPMYLLMINIFDIEN